MIIHILKDGTVKQDMSDVIVPKEILEKICNMAKGENKNE